MHPALRHARTVLALIAGSTGLALVTGALWSLLTSTPLLRTWGLSVLVVGCVMCLAAAPVDLRLVTAGRRRRWPFSLALRRGADHGVEGLTGTGVAWLVGFPLLAIGLTLLERA